MDLDGCAALVTGGSGDIGAATRGAGTDSRRQPTPLPNKNMPFTCDFMSSMVASLSKYGFTAARSRS